MSFQRNDQLRPITALIILIFLATVLSCSRDYTIQKLVIGTGSTRGLYYPTGVGIASAVNGEYLQSNLNIVTETSEGSPQNIIKLLTGEYDLAIIQADILHNAYNRNQPWESLLQNRNLAALMSLYPEIITIITHKNSGITSPEDLQGKKINIGPAGSGTRINANNILALYLPETDDSTIIFEESISDSFSLLINGDLDACFITIGHPNDQITELFRQDPDITFCPIQVSEDYLAAHPYYTRVSLPLSFYTNSGDFMQVESIGVMAILTANITGSTNTIYTLMKKLYVNREILQKSLPILENIDYPGMVSGIPIPLHPGSKQFYKELN